MRMRAKGGGQGTNAAGVQRQQRTARHGQARPGRYYAGHHTVALFPNHASAGSMSARRRAVSCPAAPGLT